MWFTKIGANMGNASAKSKIRENLLNSYPGWTGSLEDSETHGITAFKLDYLKFFDDWTISSDGTDANQAGDFKLAGKLKKDGTVTFKKTYHDSKKNIEFDGKVIEGKNVIKGTYKILNKLAGTFTMEMAGTREYMLRRNLYTTEFLDFYNLGLSKNRSRILSLGIDTVGLYFAKGRIDDESNASVTFHYFNKYEIQLKGKFKKEARSIKGNWSVPKIGKGEFVLERVTPPQRRDGPPAPVPISIQQQQLINNLAFQAFFGPQKIKEKSNLYGAAPFLYIDIQNNNKPPPVQEIMKSEIAEPSIAGTQPVTIIQPLEVSFEDEISPAPPIEQTARSTTMSSASSQQFGANSQMVEVVQEVQAVEPKKKEATFTNPFASTFDPVGAEKFNLYPTQSQPWATPFD